ncbi:EF-hand domain-containing family member C2 [Contarinia nasturtii]|uniref:EF-hand domain-containing family member C2 n=1 Tax=Contarinia nasturtii TaxID=265458 RepID=UPI0012D4AA5F|nr:EF-hand domain-containing family member C2 [Contarinia nasturtii]
MNRKPKLPLIPGFVVHKPKENYHLPQCWSHIGNTRILVEKKHADNNWILNDGKILCFKAYFRQNLVGSSGSAQFQIRKVKILFYMEDGTIQVVEPRTDNSGIPQGCIVKRQRIPCSSSTQNQCLSMLDLNVQKEVEIFDRIYIITDCDGFTRSYLNRAGIEVPHAIETPKDPIHLTREEMQESRPVAGPSKVEKKENKLEKFLRFDNLCLKFDAYWDDRDSPLGDIHDLIVYYYLSDDTIQINEIFKQGRPTTLYKRLKLPKRTDDVLMLDQKSNATVLNVLGRDFMNARCITDKLDIGKPNIDFYTDADLKIGEKINVFGRSVILTDCDKFTRDYYQQKYGIEEFIPIARPKETRWKQPYIEKVMPPYNGWGTFEDSESSCYSIQLKVPQRDMKKFLELDKCNLRFKAQMISNIDENSDREFVITYYLSDDTISVFEIGKRNACQSRDFLKRSRFYLPNQNVYTSQRPLAYTPQMFYIGANVNLKGFEYHLTDADEFTLNFMESHSSEFPMANISSILSKIKEAITPNYKEFIGKYLNVAETTSKPDSLNICYDTTALALRDLLDNRISEHEIVTFLRYFSAKKVSNKSQILDRTTIQSLVQMALTTNLWDDLESIKEFMYDVAPDHHNGFMPPSKIRTIIRGCRIPIKGVMIDDMFSVLNKDSDGNIDVNDFLYFIDNKKCKAPPVQPINVYNENDKKSFNSSYRRELVDWAAFIAALGLETELKQETE